MPSSKHTSCQLWTSQRSLAAARCKKHVYRVTVSSPNRKQKNAILSMTRVNYRVVSYSWNGQDLTLGNCNSNWSRGANEEVGIKEFIFEWISLKATTVLFQIASIRVQIPIPRKFQNIVQMWKTAIGQFKQSLRWISQRQDLLIVGNLCCSVKGVGWSFSTRTRAKTEVVHANHVHCLISAGWRD